jgi:hypothetical protein
VLVEWRYSSTHSLTSALDGGEWSASRACRFTSRERVPSTHWIGGWVGSRAVLDAVVKSKIPSPYRESNPRTTISSPLPSRYTGEPQGWSERCCEEKNSHHLLGLEPQIIHPVAQCYTTELSRLIQPHQRGIHFQHFADCLCLHPQRPIDPEYIITRHGRRTDDQSVPKVPLPYGP